MYGYVYLHCICKHMDIFGVTALETMQPRSAVGPNSNFLI